MSAHLVEMRREGLVWCGLVMKGLLKDKGKSWKAITDLEDCGTRREGREQKEDKKTVHNDERETENNKDSGE